MNPESDTCSLDLISNGFPTGPFDGAWNVLRVADVIEATGHHVGRFKLLGEIRHIKVYFESYRLVLLFEGTYW
jgi:hypothetical protein